MKTTLLSIITLLIAGVTSQILAQQDLCPKENRMKEGSCLIISYESEEMARQAVTAPAEILVISESSHEISNGTYIAQSNCNGNEVIYTKAGKCTCSEYHGVIDGTFKFMNSEMTCKFDAAGVLPVEFSFFKAKKEGDLTLLEWATEFEADNEGFYVERSTDGHFFQEFAFIVGEGNSNVKIEYEALDRSPYAGLNYYRLKQVDYNGNERYSEIVRVDFRSNTDGTIISYSNSNEELTIRSKKSLRTIEIFDLAGVRIYRGNLAKGSDEHRVSLSGQKTGHFVAIITDENGSIESLKFAKL